MRGYVARAVIHLRTTFTIQQKEQRCPTPYIATTTLTTFGIGYNFYDSSTKAEGWYIINVNPKY